MLSALRLPSPTSTSVPVEVPDHVLHERGRLHDELDPPARLALHLEPAHLAHGVIAGAVRRLEGGEVVAADEVARGLAHRADVERARRAATPGARASGARVARFSMT